MDALRSVSQGKVESFYDTIRTMRKEFYILHIRNALIHPAGNFKCKRVKTFNPLTYSYTTELLGVAAWDCGYYLGTDGCESRFGLATDWWNGCRGFLAQSSISLHHLFNSTAVLHPDDGKIITNINEVVNFHLLFHFYDTCDLYIFCL